MNAARNEIRQLNEIAVDCDCLNEFVPANAAEVMSRFGTYEVRHSQREKAECLCIYSEIPAGPVANGSEKKSAAQ